MPRSLSYAPLAGKKEARAIAEILARSFAFPVEEALPWLEYAGTRNVRVLREGATPMACAMLLPMGQYFGGRAVPMTGVAAVAVAPHLRGRGAAAAIMTSVLREMRQRGVPISTLYPATQPLYRKVGYEQAGGRFEITIPAAAIETHRDRAPDVRPVEVTDRAALVETYRRKATLSPGFLDRSDYIWNRVVSPRDERAFGYVAEWRGAVEGYVYVVQRRAEAGRHALYLTDFVATTGRAARRLLSFFAEHRSLATTVTFYAEPTPPLLSMLGEQAYSLRLHSHWMVRIVDVPRALEGRGYPAGIEAELALAMTDDVLRENRGTWTLEVSNGRALARRGGRGGLTLDVRALASLYTGYLSAGALRALGRLRGSERDIGLANALFSGPAPGMPDMF